MLSDDDMQHMQVCRECRLAIVFDPATLLWVVAAAKYLGNDAPPFGHTHEPDEERAVRNRQYRHSMIGKQEGLPYSPPMIPDGEI